MHASMLLNRRWPAWLGSVLALSIAAGCSTPASKTVQSAPDAIYSGGDILTMAGATPQYVEALAIGGGRILGAGTRVDMMKLAGPATRQFDLQGQTLMPGFIDAHGHLVYATHSMLDADLIGVKNIPELLERLKKHAAETPEGERIVGMGYRAEQMTENRHPTREELDTVSSTRPIGISDGSGHHGVMNTALMNELKLSAATPDPEGGFYTRKPGSRELAGHAAESAWMAVLATRAPLTTEQTRKGVKRAVSLWVEHGITTASEMGLGLSGDDIDIARTLIDEQLMPIDLVMFAKYAESERIIDAAYQIQKSRLPAGTDTATALLSGRPDLDRRYINRLRLAGVKFWLDGSIDTAFMSQPFTKNPPGVTTKDYKGQRVDPQDQLVAALDKYWKSHRQVAAHAIGDEANEQLLKAIEGVIAKQGMTDARPIFQHAQFVRPDQISRIKAVGGTPSMTAGGLQAMGDYVSALVGPERIGWTGAAASMQKQGINWTLNTDWPAGLSPSLLFAAWNVVNRVTKSGSVFVPNERVSAYDAMRSLTINGAWQYKEEQNKGTLEAGKLADLVILDRNPLKVDPMAIKDIKVMQTIKEGAAVYTRMPDGPKFGF